jgi:hypothetical protein
MRSKRETPLVAAITSELDPTRRELSPNLSLFKHLTFPYRSWPLTKTLPLSRTSAPSLKLKGLSRKAELSRWMVTSRDRPTMTSTTPSAEEAASTHAESSTRITSTSMARRSKVAPFPETKLSHLFWRSDDELTCQTPMKISRERSLSKCRTPSLTSWVTLSTDVSPLPSTMSSTSTMRMRIDLLN